MTQKGSKLKAAICDAIGELPPWSWPVAAAVVRRIWRGFTAA